MTCGGLEREGQGWKKWIRTAQDDCPLLMGDGLSPASGILPQPQVSSGSWCLEYQPPWMGPLTSGGGLSLVDGDNDMEEALGFVYSSGTNSCRHNLRFDCSLWFSSYSCLVYFSRSRTVVYDGGCGFSSPITSERLLFSFFTTSFQTFAI